MLVTPLTPVIGAEVSAVDLTGVLKPELTDALHQELMKHHVLFFREQNLTAQELTDFATNFGPIAGPHHTYPALPGHPSVMVLDTNPDNPPDSAEWHSDLTFQPSSAFASVLQGVIIPPVGGDTLWSSLFAVHDALPSGLRRDLEDLSAVHDLGSFRNQAFAEGGSEKVDQLMASVGSAAHPIIDHHPVTGRPFINVNETFTIHVLGMSRPESHRLLTFLFDFINRPQFHVRLRWHPGTIALWDNRGSQHYAVDDYLPHRRVMHRVVVTADQRQPSKS
ncbi:MAG: TauD/TfdA family dioxygenase [Acidimicrobiales bacterium]|nr:TauD/TfdA family dioxygenase [Acidimicrobiales bacterium]